MVGYCKGSLPTPCLQEMIGSLWKHGANPRTCLIFLFPATSGKKEILLPLPFSLFFGFCIYLFLKHCFVSSSLFYFLIPLFLSSSCPLAFLNSSFSFFFPLRFLFRLFFSSFFVKDLLLRFQRCKTMWCFRSLQKFFFINRGPFVEISLPWDSY